MLCAAFQSDTYQEDIYPMTAGTEPALSASEWLSGINRGKKNQCTCSLLLLGFTNTNVQPDLASWQRKCCNATQPCHLQLGFRSAVGLHTLSPSIWPHPDTDTLQNKQLRPRSLIFRRTADGNTHYFTLPRYIVTF